MNPRTLFLFACLLAGLGAFAWWQTNREAATPAVGERALLEGFDRSRVTSLRVDQFVYSLQLELARTEAGRWQLVDPIEFPADEAVVGWLLDALAQNVATEVVDPIPKGLGFEPPHAVLLVRESIDGRPRERRIELGLADVDGMHQFLRVDGRIVRALGNLENILDRPRDAWRSKHVLDVDPRALVAFGRRGKVADSTGAESFDLELDAVLDSGGWTALRPFEAALDPSYVLAWLQMFADLRAKAYIDEAVGRPEVVGLDAPDLEFDFTDTAGRKFELHLRRDRLSAAWFAKLSDRPYVWRVDGAAGDALLIPTEEFIDRQFTRVPKGEIAQVRLVFGGNELWIERFEGRWIVWNGAETERVHSAPADAAAVETLIGKLATTPFVQRVKHTGFETDDPNSGIWLGPKGGLLGGRLGRTVDTPEGGHGALFQRDGESLVFLLDPAIVELASTPRHALESRQVLRLRELDLVRASITGAGMQRKYVRTPQGRWQPDGVEQEAKEFALLVDRLIGLRAERWVANDTGGELTEPLVVSFTDAFGNPSEFTLALGGDRAFADFAGKRAEVDAALHADVRRLLRP